MVIAHGGEEPQGCGGARLVVGITSSRSHFELGRESGLALQEGRTVSFLRMQDTQLRSVSRSEFRVGGS